MHDPDHSRVGDRRWKCVGVLVVEPNAFHDRLFETPVPDQTLAGGGMIEAEDVPLDVAHANGSLFAAIQDAGVALGQAHVEGDLPNVV